MTENSSVNLMESEAWDNSSRLLEFLVSETPAVGSVMEIIDGLYWLRFGLPMSGLDHINLWALADETGWTIVDTGIADKASRMLWEQHFTGFMQGRPVRRVLATHLHPDHTGLAGWLCRKFDASLLMSRGEYFLCRILASDTGKVAPREGLDFYRKAGYDESQLELYKLRFGGFGKAISALPHSYQRLCEGELIRIGQHDWQVLVGSGHSPEHVCLWSSETGVCLSGDQLLPNISSNVSVWPTEPEGNPLEAWISSCKKLKTVLPEDTLICPAHGIPFRGAHRRLDKLISHHEKALTRLYELCRRPCLATEVYAVLFRREINDSNRIMAVGESIAHLNCLLARGRLMRELNDQGQFVYQSV